MRLTEGKHHGPRALLISSSGQHIASSISLHLQLLRQCDELTYGSGPALGI